MNKSGLREFCARDAQDGICDMRLRKRLRLRYTYMRRRYVGPRQVNVASPHQVTAVKIADEIFIAQIVKASK